MLDQNTINSRLSEMQQSPAPNILWDETCEGSGRALVVFVGPSPGGRKQEVRHPMHKACFRPLWDESFDKPLSWSRGFRESFRPLVEALFRLPYATAGKLIARANLNRNLQDSYTHAAFSLRVVVNAATASSTSGV